MSTLRTAADDYLAIRRSLGFKLRMQGRLLMDFVDYLEQAQSETVTTDAAVEWATQPTGASPEWHAARLGVARRFATHLCFLDPRCEVPPRDVLPERHRRLPPYIYSADDIAALMEKARQLRPAQRAVTHETVIGLLAVTGMRSGEVIRLNRGDVDLVAATLRVIDTKFGKSRELSLQATTVNALETYARLRDECWPGRSSPSFFLSSRGKRMSQSTLNSTFFQLVRAAGLEPDPTSMARRPRPHDLRHTFAVTTLVAWYRADEDVGARLPALSAFMGHVEPKDTYWYFSAVPELMALASERVQRRKEARP